ncbi:Protein transport protein bos1 [Savitreella phatthalungensis]
MAAAIGNSCVKQLKLVRRELTSYESAITSCESDISGTSNGGDNLPALRGALTASLSTLTRLLDDFDGVVRADGTSGDRRDKNLARSRDLRNQRNDLARDISLANTKADGALTTRNRSRLLDNHQQHRTSTPDNPYGHVPTQREPVSRADGNTRETHALSRVSAALDEYIESGLASLGDLRDQTGALKGAQRKVRDIGVSLGLGGETIRWIERRTSQDRWVFYGGCAFTLFMFFVIYHYLG